MIKRVLYLCVQHHCFINVHFVTEYLNPYEPLHVSDDRTQHKVLKRMSQIAFISIYMID